MRAVIRDPRNRRGMTMFRTMYRPLSAALLFACGGAHQEAPTTGGPLEQNRRSSLERADPSTVARLAAARCVQEQECNNVGPDAKYASRNICTDELRGSIGNDLSAYDCPRGLDQEGVERCMATLISEACSRPFDDLTRFSECRTKALCTR